MEHHLFGVLTGQAGDLPELFVELLAQAADPVAFSARLVLHAPQIILAMLEVLLVAPEALVPIPEGRLALLEGPLQLLPLARLTAQLLLETTLVQEPLLAGLEKSLSLVALRLATGLLDDLLGLVPGAVDLGSPQAAFQAPAKDEPA